MAFAPFSLGVVVVRVVFAVVAIVAVVVVVVWTPKEQPRTKTLSKAYSNSAEDNVQGRYW